VDDRDSPVDGATIAQLWLPPFYKEASIKTSTRQKSRIGADDPRVARPVFSLRETAAYLGLAKSMVQYPAGEQCRGAGQTYSPSGGREIVSFYS